MTVLQELVPAKKRRVRKSMKGQGSSFLRRNFPQVEEVVDSKKSVEVVVEQADCTQGVKGEPTECALARAAKREFAADGMVIGMSYSYIIKGTVAYRFVTSNAVGREITSFDRHQDFAPGTYILGKVSPSNRLGMGAERDRERRLAGGGHSQRRIVHKRTARVRSLRERD